MVVWLHVDVLLWLIGHLHITGDCQHNEEDKMYRPCQPATRLINLLNVGVKRHSNHEAFSYSARPMTAEDYSRKHTEWLRERLYQNPQPPMSNSRKAHAATAIAIAAPL